MKNRSGPMPRLILGAGLAALIVGVVVFGIAVSQPVSYNGATLGAVSDVTFSVSGVHVLSTRALIGAAITVLSLLVLAAWFGYRKGVRSNSNPASR